MELVNRNNTVTIEIDLDSWVSVRDAIAYIKTEASSNIITDNNFSTNKVKIIKMVRSYGVAVSDGSIEVGLKTAKDFVEDRLDQLKS